MKRLGVEERMEGKRVAKIAADESISKSEKIRKLFDGGLELKEIAALVGVGYNFVYNVVRNYATVKGIEIESTKQASKRDAIVQLLKSGLTLSEVSKQTKTNYNYVWKINNELKAEQAAENKEEAQVQEAL